MSKLDPNGVTDRDFYADADSDLYTDTDAITHAYPGSRGHVRTTGAD
jgi:hypothetical protein